MKPTTKCTRCPKFFKPLFSIFLTTLPPKIWLSINSPLNLKICSKIISFSGCRSDNMGKIAEVIVNEAYFLIFSKFWSCGADGRYWRGSSRFGWWLVRCIKQATPVQNLKWKRISFSWIKYGLEYPILRLQFKTWNGEIPFRGSNLS